jgi:hypothetical protein
VWSAADIGLGRSKQIVEEYGGAQVYMEYLHKVMMFAALIICVLALLFASFCFLLLFFLLLFLVSFSICKLCWQNS